MLRPALMVAVLAMVGCHRNSPCERAVHRVFELTVHAGPPGSEPKADEQAVIDQVERMAIGRCEDEGLSDAQLQCILAMRTFEDMKTVTRCPAIAAKMPSWLIAGPPPDEPPPP